MPARSGAVPHVEPRVGVVERSEAIRLAAQMHPPGLTRGRGDVKRMRRIRICRSPKPRLWLFVILAASTTVVFLVICRPRTTFLNYYLTIVWSAYLPLLVIGLIGASTSRKRTHRRSPRSYYNGRTDRMLIVTVPTLIRPENLPALKRVVSSILVHLPRHFSRFRVDLIVESGADLAALKEWLAGIGSLGRRVNVMIVPESYTTPNGARFKTRANQYGMEVRRFCGENTENTYVYHIDDDTSIGEDTAASLAEFIENQHGNYYLAQGTLAFPRELTPSFFCWMADAIRPADDITRFAFFTGTLGTPLGGLHGEHLIVRADIEDEIGWDFPNTVIEDAYFGIEFCGRYPGYATTLNSYTYGASPYSVRDLVRQRRRWIEGLLHLAGNKRLPLARRLPLLYSIACWALAPFQFVGVALAISYFCAIRNTSPIAWWFTPIWSACLAYIFWEYIEGLRINVAASQRLRRYTPYALAAIPFVYVAAPVETLGVVIGFMRFFGLGRQRVSEVISKPL